MSVVGTVRGLNHSRSIRRFQHSARSAAGGAGRAEDSLLPPPALLFGFERPRLLRGEDL